VFEEDSQMKLRISKSIKEYILFPAFSGNYQGDRKAAAPGVYFCTSICICAIMKIQSTPDSREKIVWILDMDRKTRTENWS
jgi:hypothetical protein